MFADFIMNHLSYEECLRLFGFVIIIQSFAVNELAKYKGETFFALIPLLFITFGALLAYSIVGYVLAAIVAIATIYSIIYTIRKKSNNAIRQSKKKMSMTTIPYKIVKKSMSFTLGRE
jgi:predicted membrane protein